MKNMYVEILVKFKNKSELCEYTTDVLNLLVTDKDVDYICLAETQATKTRLLFYYLQQP